MKTIKSSFVFLSFSAFSSGAMAYSRSCDNKTLPTFRSRLPIIRINTNYEVPGRKEIPVTMEVIDNSDGKLMADAVNAADEAAKPENIYRATMKIRGSSSALFPKKQYSIKIFENDDRSKKKIKLLGLPKSDDWVFNVSFQDKTLIRDPFTFSLANDLGHYTSQTKFFELIENCEYRGVYDLLEKIARGKGHVELPTWEDGGGFIIRHDDAKGPDDHFTTAQKTQLLWIYPKPDDVTASEAGKANFDKLLSNINALESALSAPDFGGAENSYLKYVDLDSFVDFAVVQELSNNFDGYRRSVYMHGTVDGKIVMGPYWDYDIAYGNMTFFKAKRFDIWRIDAKNPMNDGMPWMTPHLPWFNKMRNDPTFRARFQKRWKELRQTLLSDEALMARVDADGALLGGAETRNFEKWKILGAPDRLLYMFFDPRPWPSTYAGEVDKLKNWIKERTRWIDDNVDAF